jgi:hypothetical protein
MSPSTRALLAAAREGLGPDPAAAARVKAKLDALLAAPAAAAASAAPAAAAGGGLAVKLAAAVALATASAAVVIAVPTSHPQPTAVRAPALEDVITVEQPVVTIRAAAIVRDEVAVPDVPREPTPVKRVRAATAPVVAPSPPEVSLAREVQLIDDAMASLRSGHATEALAAVAAYHRETGDRGQLAEEASAIEIEASCTLHVDVRDKLAAFDRTWPSSAQRSRLTAACH